MHSASVKHAKPSAARGGQVSNSCVTETSWKASVFSSMSRWHEGPVQPGSLQRKYTVREPWLFTALNEAFLKVSV